MIPFQVLLDDTIVDTIRLLDVESYTIGQITTQGLLIYIFLVFFDKFSGYNRENKLKSLG